MSSDFYQNLRSFSNFSHFTDDKHFCPCPDDWNVVITDIRGSTKAIREGRYKEVNSMGAASIVMARKALGSLDFPFVFGGDGATLLIHDNDLEKVARNLSSLQKLGKENYNLDLRVGIVPLKKLKELGEEILVGKFELTEGRSIAILKGGGLTLAEKLIKSKSEYLSQFPTSDSIDLSGLSCRWQPIPSRRGKILTILCFSRADHKPYERFLEFLGNALPEGIIGANPTNTNEARYKSLLALIKEERRLHDGLSIGMLLRFLEILISVWAFRLKLPPLLFDSKKYEESMRSHSDYRKFDDLLRMVIDCSLQEIESIRSYLEKEFETNQIYYGLHETDSSLMTCFVDGLGQGQHIHFIDAENGGYTAAAVHLKAQMKSAAES